MRILRRFFDHGLRTVLIAMMMLLLGLMSLQVVLRYGFSTSLIWGEEVCRYLLIWISFLAVICAYERGEIASVPMLRDALSRRAGLALAICANICGIILLAVLIWYGLEYAAKIGASPIPAVRLIFGDEPGAWPMPHMYLIYIALPIGLGLLALRLFADIFLYAAMWHRPDAKASDLRDSGDTGGTHG